MKQGKLKQESGLAFTKQDDLEFEPTSDDEEEACESALRSLELISSADRKNTESEHFLYE